MTVSGHLVAKPTKFGELPAAAVLIAIGCALALSRGAPGALESIPFLLLGAGLAAWTLLMRLRFTPERLVMSIGPWRRSVDLTALESVRWKMTGGGRSQGTIFVRDRSGGRVPIYVGRFTRQREWGPWLLAAAQRSGGEVDSRARTLLAG